MDKLDFGTTISVVVGGRKRAKLFYKCLKSIDNNDVKKLQKIIVNNGHKIKYIDSVLNKLNYTKSSDKKNKFVDIYKKYDSQWEVINIPINSYSFFDLGDVWKISLKYALQIAKYDTFQLISDDDYISKNYVSEALNIFSKYKTLSLIIPNISDHNIRLNEIVKLNYNNKDEKITNFELLKRLTSISRNNLNNPGAIFLANTHYLKDYMQYCSEPTPDVGFSIFLSNIGDIYLSSKMTFYKTTHDLQDHIVINKEDGKNIFYFSHLIRTLNLIEFHYKKGNTPKESIKVAKLYLKQIFIQNCILNISKFIKNRQQLNSIPINILFLLLFHKTSLMTLIKLIKRKYTFHKL